MVTVVKIKKKLNGMVKIKRKKLNGMSAEFCL